MQFYGGKLETITSKYTTLENGVSGGCKDKSLRENANYHIQFIYLKMQKNNPTFQHYIGLHQTYDKDEEVYLQK